MPFQTTAIRPPMNPRISIGFSGLMVLRPGANDTCEVGIHRFTTSHECRVILIVRRPNRPPTLLNLLKGPLEAPFSVSLFPDPNPGAGDFKVFAPTPDPFVRNAPGNHELDYRWAVNLRDLHPNANLNDGAQPLVTLKTGILYTSSLTLPIIAPRFERPGASNIPLERMASSLTAAVITPPGSHVVFSWRDLGNQVDFLLPRDGDPPNTTYNVCFTNDPPGISGELHDEMFLFYRVLEENGGRISTGQQFSLQYDRVNTRTDEIPCLTPIQNP